VADCALIETCIFFNDRMANMPSMAGMYKKRYCHAEWQQCARYRVFDAVGRENVPADLYPNDEAKVDLVIATVREGT
jgi:hypothetical protein